MSNSQEVEIEYYLPIPASSMALAFLVVFFVIACSEIPILFSSLFFIGLVLIYVVFDLEGAKKHKLKIEEYKDSNEALEVIANFKLFEPSKVTEYDELRYFSYRELLLLAEFKREGQVELFNQIVKARQQQTVLSELLEFKFDENSALKEKCITNGHIVHHAFIDNVARYSEFTTLIKLADKNSIEKQLRSCSAIEKIAFKERLSIIEYTQELMKEIVTDNQMLLVKLNGLITIIASIKSDSEQGSKELGSILSELDSLADRASKYDVVTQLDPMWKRNL